jgi:hypothetical protein
MSALRKDFEKGVSLLSFGATFSIAIMRLIQKLIVCAAAVALIGALPLAPVSAQNKAPENQTPAANLETVDLVVAGMV